MPVGIDPSHSVGSRSAAPDGILDLFHVAAQGVIAGANIVLVDFHPNPAKALVDGPQALLISELPHFLEDISLARQTYLQRAALAARHRAQQ
jgi:3-deoxy-7-phosphoheptulonate synthase